jgi:hypothetical protein
MHHQPQIKADVPHQQESDWYREFVGSARGNSPSLQWNPEMNTPNRSYRNYVENNTICFSVRQRINDSSLLFSGACRFIGRRERTFTRQNLPKHRQQRMEFMLDRLPKNFVIHSFVRSTTSSIASRISSTLNFQSLGDIINRIFEYAISQLAFQRTGGHQIHSSAQEFL